MNKNHKNILFFGVILIVPLLIFVIAKAVNSGQELEILGPVSEEDGEIQYHTISDFSFTDQNSETITLAASEGKIMLANFFFTTCPSICPIMTSNMRRLQGQVNAEDVIIYSFTVNPSVDKPEVLAAYADNYDIDPSNWHLLTGDKKKIYMVARNEFLLPVLEGDGGPSDFIHSELFVLVDKKKQIRGYYDGTDESDVNRLINDIQKLRKQQIL